MGKLGQAAHAAVAFDLPRPPEDPARAAADFAAGMRLRDYRFDHYKTKKKDDEEVKGTPKFLLGSISRPPSAGGSREAKP